MKQRDIEGLIGRQMRLASLGVPRGQSSRGSTRHLAFRRLRSSGCCRIRSCPQWCGPQSWNMSPTKPLGVMATRDSSCAGFRLGSMGLLCPAPPFATRIRPSSTGFQQFPLLLPVNRVGRLTRRHRSSGLDLRKRAPVRLPVNGQILARVCSQSDIRGHILRPSLAANLRRQWQRDQWCSRLNGMGAQQSPKSHS